MRLIPADLGWLLPVDVTHGLLVAFVLPRRTDAELDQSNSALIDLAQRHVSPTVTMEGTWHGNDTWVCAIRGVTDQELHTIATRVGQAMIGQTVTWPFTANREGGKQKFTLGAVITPALAGTT